MIRCQHCGTDNLNTAQYCDECGAKLAPRPVGRTLSPASSGDDWAGSVQPDIEPVRRPHKTLASADSGRAARADGGQASKSSVGGTPAQPKLVVIRGGKPGHEFPLTGTEWLIGRWDPNHGIFPDVDLDAHDPEAAVSRRHAQIKVESGHYVIEDLGSTNGTFINRGARLAPGLRYLIQDGDEIIVGKTFLKFVASR
jgi:pSer/pThr/pTyr-binding forkhead associated (FHA) protein